MVKLDVQRGVTMFRIRKSIDVADNVNANTQSVRHSALKLTTGLAAAEDMDHLMWQGQLKLRFHASTSHIRIHVIQARYVQLTREENFSTYVEVRLAPKNKPHCELERSRTKLVSNSASPVYDEIVTFTTSHLPKHTRIYIELYMICTSSGTGAKFLGGMSFSVDRLQRKQARDICSGSTPNLPKILSAPNPPQARLRRSSVIERLTRCNSALIPHMPCIKADMFSNPTVKHRLANTFKRQTSAPSWYYLFSKPACYSHHLNARQSLLEVNETKLGTSTPIHCRSPAVDSGVALESVTSMFHPVIFRFTIPKGEDGFGFTLGSCAAGGITYGNGLLSPGINGETMSPNPFECTKLRVHNVRANSSAELVGLPVGSYLIEVDQQRLDPEITLKDAVRVLRKAAAEDPEGALKIGVVVPTSSGRSSYGSNQSRVFTQTDGSFLSSSSGSSHHVLEDLKKLDHEDIRPVDYSLARSPGQSGLSVNNSRRHTTSFAYQNTNGSHTTPIGNALVCEERSIDVASDLNKHTDQTPHPRYLIAQPILNLRWSEVSAIESKRQWAIANLLNCLCKLSDEMLAGVKTYRTAMKRVVRLDKSELDSFFQDLAMIACLAWRMSQRLQECCLPYLSADNTRPLQFPGTSPANFKSIRSHSNESIEKSESHGGKRKATFFTRLRRSLTIRSEEFTGCDEVKSHKESGSSETTNPSDAHTPPTHGHLDNPGSLLSESLPQFLELCSIYSEGYLPRLHFVQDLRSDNPELRDYFRQLARTPGVPTLTNFLSLPQELQRHLLNNLEEILKFTQPQHNDRIPLEQCVSSLREAVMGTPANDAVETPVSQFVFQPSTVPDLLMVPRAFSHDISDENPVSHLFSLLRSPLFVSCKLDSNVIQNDHDIIFSGPLTCKLEQGESNPRGTPSCIVELYNGQVFVYLLAHYLLVLATSEDVLKSARHANLLCEPIPLNHIKNTDFSADSHFILETTTNMNLSFQCVTNEMKLVWKTLLKQRISSE